SVEQLREPLHIRRLVELRTMIEGLRLTVALQRERAAAPRDAATLAEEADLGLTPAGRPGEKHGRHAIGVVEQQLGGVFHVVGAMAQEIGRASCRERGWMSV